MIIYTHQRSKNKKNLTKKQRELRDSWQELVQRHAPKKATNKNVESWKPAQSYTRETVHYPSLKESGGNATKPIEGKFYTGTKMLGIGTLHKSNAVPIFSEEDAKDQANMRR